MFPQAYSTEEDTLRATHLKMGLQCTAQRKLMDEVGLSAEDAWKLSRSFAENSWDKALHKAKTNVTGLKTGDFIFARKSVGDYITDEGVIIRFDDTANFEIGPVQQYDYVLAEQNSPIIVLL